MTEPMTDEQARDAAANALERERLRPVPPRPTDGPVTEEQALRNARRLVAALDEELNP